jgi:outer membrane beta-barrel protein
MARRCAALLMLASLAVALPAWAADPDKPDKSDKSDKKSGQEKEAEDTGKTHQASLADKIPPVTGNLFVKAHRFEITPTFGVSLDDAFFQKYAFGLKLTYHLVESFSLGVHGAYHLSTVGGAVNVCDDSGCGKPTMDTLGVKKLPGRLIGLAGLDIAWSPIYGKVNVIAEKVLHFDISIIVGIDAIFYQQPENENDATPKLNPTVGGHLALCERFFITPSITLRVELRDYLYSSKIGTLGDATSKIENQLMLELGVSFFVGGGGSKE